MLNLNRSSILGRCLTILDRYWLIISGCLMVVILVEVSIITSPKALANHRASLEWHQTKMHSADTSQKEAACVQPGDTHVSGADLRLNVRSKLYIENTAENWDELANNRIYLDLPFVNGAYQPCSGFPNRSSIPIEIYEAHDPSIQYTNWYYASPCGNMACTKNDVAIWNSTVNHWDRRDSYVFFAERNLYVNTQTGGNHAWHNDSQRAYVISHEFGHVFGLADGTGDLCNQSIMHAGKGNCGTITIFWPRQIDRDSVINIATNG